MAADTGLSPLDGPILSALIYIGVGASVVSFLAWSLAIERIGMVRAGIIYNSIPLFASLEATLFLGESITLPQMIGGVLIIGGLPFTSIRDKIQGFIRRSLRGKASSQVILPLTP